MFMQLTGTDKSGHFIEVSKMSDVSTELSIFFFLKNPQCSLQNIKT